MAYLKPLPEQNTSTLSCALFEKNHAVEVKNCFIQVTFN